MTIQGNINAIIDEWEDALDGARIICHYDTRRHTIYLDHLYIPVKYRRKGYGSKILDALTNLAWLENVNLVVEPDDSLGTSYETLVEFYSQNGFNFSVMNPDVMVFEVRSNMCV